MSTLVGNGVEVGGVGAGLFFLGVVDGVWRKRGEIKINFEFFLKVSNFLN